MTKFTDLDLDSKVLKAIDQQATNIQHQSKLLRFLTHSLAVTFWELLKQAQAKQLALRYQ